MALPIVVTLLVIMLSIAGLFRLAGRNGTPRKIALLGLLGGPGMVIGTFVMYCRCDFDWDATVGRGPRD